ncbi:MULTISPECIES: peptidoglycan-binding protein LysM [Flavobacteriaceae]|uniref:Peptidoglycan-binding protein LysM n=2 Tax=Flavobacteriaceae TaxID=49546 RepID=A0A4Y8AVD2_9FLAO|nr:MULTISPECIES: peptidoglycan-binding protein LysM [Flavobacteriaceae]TEW75433.1 peptidoglycan-binding protein LysM [Gramella jeungdoensis]GGK45161.1 peptidoglycan-binding protein LysM [Lutibacter litoralis]
MRKVIVFLSLLVIIVIASAFTEEKNNLNKFTDFQSEISSVATQQETLSSLEVNIPFIGKSFNGFREAVAFKESQGRYHVVNTLGYLGKYQFGRSTLKRFKIYNTHNFLNTPELQEDAFVALCSLNKWILRKDIVRSVGKKINGIVITESGILAAAHLSGAGNVKKYLRSHGQNTFKDAYGSSIQHYMKLFSGYDTSFIEANRKPAV